MVEQLDGLRGGFFVDVGAYDGVEHSNTLALERDYGWRGLCVEPNTAAYLRLIVNRPGSAWVCTLASNTSVPLPFDGVTVGAGTLMAADTLTHMLKLVDAPPVIDYVSIDVEGHELQVLDGMDFDQWTVRLITVETNVYIDGPARKDAIHERLTARGFVRIREDVVAPGYGPFEDWFRNARSLAS